MSLESKEKANHTLLSLLRRVCERRLEKDVVSTVQAMDALPTPAMRFHRLQQWLEPLLDEWVVEALDGMVRGAQNDRPHFRSVTTSLLDLTPLLDAVGEQRVLAWRLIAREKAHPGALALLNPNPPKKVYYRPDLQDVNEQMECIPLGWRKARARGGTRKFLDRLLYDKHPEVIRILLDGPHLLERDVVKMAALTPSTAQALTAIYRHPRWISRYSVKKALSFNPYAPIAMAQSLLGFLLEQDLRLAAHTFKLSPQVRASAQSLLELRRRRRRGTPSPVCQKGAAQQPAPAARLEPTTKDLASAFLATLPEVDQALAQGAIHHVIMGLPPKELHDAEAKKEVMREVEAFVTQLPSSLPLTPVGDLEEDE